MEPYAGESGPPEPTRSDYNHNDRDQRVQWMADTLRGADMSDTTISYGDAGGSRKAEAAA